MTYFFPENPAVYENVEKFWRAGKARWKYGSCVLHAGYLRLNTNTLKMCNNYCFSTATMVARTRLNVTLYVHCLSRKCFLTLLAMQCVTFVTTLKGIKSGKCLLAFSLEYISSLSDIWKQIKGHRNIILNVFCFVGTFHPFTCHEGS